jgi:hypothetical protein
VEVIKLTVYIASTTYSLPRLFFQWGLKICKCLDCVYVCARARARERLVDGGKLNVLSKTDAHHDLIIHCVWNKLKYGLCFPYIKKNIKLCYFISKCSCRKIYSPQIVSSVRGWYKYPNTSPCMSRN